MAKQISLILVVVLLALSLPATAEFKPSLLDSYSMSASEWYSSSTNRLMLTVLLAMSTLRETRDENYIKMLDNTTYVGVKGNSLVVAGFSENKGLMVLYYPGKKTAETLSFSGGDGSNTELMVRLVLDDQGGEYMANDADEVRGMMALLFNNMD